MSLSSQQVKALRAESHRLKLKPVVMIGQHGLSENVLIELEQTLAHHELIKVKVPAQDKADKKGFNEKICEKLNADLIQAIGHIIVIFRKNPKSQKFDKILRLAKSAD